MLTRIILIVFCLFSVSAFAQFRRPVSPVNLTPYSVKPFKKNLKIFDSLELHKEHPEKTFWSASNKVGLDISEVSFTNWNAGGTNSISALLNVEIKRVYKRKYIRWKNEFLARYGINKQKGSDVMKTDDKVEINSTFGYRKDTLSTWFYSAKLNFNTQFSNGYNYPDTSNKISGLMAPANIFVGVGMEYGSNMDNFNLYSSPLTARSTLVLDQELADDGAFGVEPAVYDENDNLIKEGERSKTEVGILITSEYDTKLFDNIGLSNRVSFFTDYLNKFGNIDIDWEVSLNFRVNDFVLAKLGSHLKYDDDIKIQVENDAGETVDGGARVQWKQQLGIGVLIEL